jgi:hypothetical protein
MSLRRSIERLGPYPSLFLLALPAATVEPLKLVAVAVAGKGHWITGTTMILVSYALSLLVVERLFRIVKPKLLTIPWFAKLWDAFVSVRTHVWTALRGCIEPRYEREHRPSTSRSAQADRPTIFGRRPPPR